MIFVADSTLASKANTGVLIQREPKDFTVLLPLNTAVPTQIAYCFP